MSTKQELLRLSAAPATLTRSIPRRTSPVSADVTRNRVIAGHLGPGPAFHFARDAASASASEAARSEM